MDETLELTCLNIPWKWLRFPSIGFLEVCEDWDGNLLFLNAMVSCFNTGAIPSRTKTGLTPRRRRQFVRKNKFLKQIKTICVFWANFKMLIIQEFCLINFICNFWSNLKLELYWDALFATYILVCSLLIWI